jgi:hypothetical protein
LTEGGAVTEITLDHLRPSPKWIKQNEELELAEECEAIIERGLEDLAKRRRREHEKLRMLREVAELFKTDWPPVRVARWETLFDFSVI